MRDACPTVRARCRRPRWRAPQLTSRLRSVARVVNRESPLGSGRWSVYGAQQAQPVASTGKPAGRRNRRNKPNLLPWVAIGCRGRQMVRRGSTVRVRQRALVRGKSPEIGDFCCLTQHHRAPPHYRREGYPARCAAAKPLQIDLLLGTSEHLPKREGIGSRVAAAARPERLGQALWRGLAREVRVGLRWGIGFWGRPTRRSKAVECQSCQRPEGSAFPLATASRGVSRVAHDWRSPACLQAPRIESRLAEPRLSCASWAALWGGRQFDPGHAFVRNRDSMKLSAGAASAKRD